MSISALVTDAFRRVQEQLHAELHGLTPEELASEPHPSIAWLAWHLTRVQDANIAPLAGRQQAWIAGGWHERFGMPAHPRDFSPAHIQTPEIVISFPAVGCEVLLAYHDYVAERTQRYVASLAATDLERILDEPQYEPRPTVAVRLVSVLNDNARHVGQIEYLRGLLRDGGWFPKRRH